MCDLVARTGRHQQRYEAGCRLVAGCIPFRYRNSDESGDADSEKIVEVLMINSSSGPGLLFPKWIEKLTYKSLTSIGAKQFSAYIRKVADTIAITGGWENDETVQEAAVREAIEEAGVRGELMDLVGYYQFKSKTHQDEVNPEGICRAAMFALLVKEELESWPEQSTRNRTWLTVEEATGRCRHAWMSEALVEGFSKWHAEKMLGAG